MSSSIRPPQRAATGGRASAAHYRSLFESINEGFCVIELLFDADERPVDYRFLQTNPAFETLTGLADAQGKRMLELAPNHEAHWFELYGHVAQTGEPAHFTEDAQHLEERTFYVHAYRFGEPQLKQVAILFEDISEDIQAERANSRLAALVESSEDAIVSKDPDGVIQTWNPAAERLFGYTAVEVTGQSITLIIPPERVREEDEILRQIRQGERVEHFETVRQRKDGRLLDVSLTISPIIDRAGAIVGASKIARDITDRRRAERMQAHQAGLLELIAAGAPLDECLTTLCRAVPQITSSVRASILVADAARQTRLRPIAPDLASSWADGLAGAPINGSRAGTCGEAICCGEPVTCEDVSTDERWSPEWRELCAANGLRATYSVPIKNDNDRAIAAFMLGFDRARGPTAWERQLADFGRHVASIALARERSNQALRAADRDKDEFLATLAHELRNPLVPLRSGLELIDGNDPERVEKARTMMKRQLTRLTHLIDDLMDVSRITRGQVTLQTAATELTAIMRDAVESARPQVKAGGHSLRLSLPAQAVTLQADSERLTQVFVNLINNAAQYTPESGQLELTLERHGDTAVAVMRDNGIGIAADPFTDIFGVFTQGEQPPGTTNEGLGIGLSLAKQVIELHGGSIEAHSEGRGKGAEFTVRLPLTAGQPNQAADNQPAATEPGALRVLLAEDNEDVADAMSLLLESMGHQVQLANDGIQALDAAPAFQPHAVLLDLGMPRLDGVETAKRLRATPEGQNVLLIAITGWGQAADRESTTEAGFDHHLVKPVEPDLLEQLLAEIDT